MTTEPFIEDQGVDARLMRVGLVLSAQMRSNVNALSRDGRQQYSRKVFTFQFEQPISRRMRDLTIKGLPR